MDIYAKPGTKVKFTNPDAGYEHDQLVARENLKVGNTYTILEIHVGGFHTNVFLREVPSVPFNSVMFE